MTFKRSRNDDDRHLGTVNSSVAVVTYSKNLKVLKHATTFFKKWVEDVRFCFGLVIIMFDIDNYSCRSTVNLFLTVPPYRFGDMVDNLHIEAHTNSQ